VSLGAVRLKIIDLEAGAQPMFSDDRDTVLVFNGEIYNHNQLRKELEALGHRFHSRSDTEVVLRAFLEWNTDSFEKLRGMFGLALWSQRDRRLVLVRDRLGIKPLYFCRKGPAIAFGSELKALFELPEIDRNIDLDGLNAYLSLNYVPSPYTLVSGIEKLPPGHWLEWRADAPPDRCVHTQAYWTLEMRPQPKRIEDAEEELDGLLRDAVREHMISDVPLGLWLSGGLDSSTVLHYAAAASSKPLQTFSITFQGRTFDESSYAAEVASAYGAEHRTFDLNPEHDLRSAIEALPTYSDEPSADAGALPVWFLSQMSRKHVTVALSGEGADEVFGGYITYLADKLAAPARILPKPVRKLALSAANLLPVSDEKIGFEYKLKRFLEGSLLEPGLAHTYWNGTFSDQGKSDVFRHSNPAVLRDLVQNVPNGYPGSQANYWFDQRYYLPDDILYKVDRMSMAHSLEVRPPFLDHRIVEFAATLPENFKVRGFRKKFLLRRLMQDRLPTRILKRKKQGLDIPIHDWFRGPLKSLLLDTLSDGMLRRSGLFHPTEVWALVRNHLDRRVNAGYHLWGLLTLLLWMDRWDITGLTPRATRSERPSALVA
jgi:asparagine synthase (glutamine-hydrolysing)